jgi:hypothetical protein
VLGPEAVRWAEMMDAHGAAAIASAVKEEFFGREVLG